MFHSWKNKQSGLTLLEVILATAIFGTAFIILAVTIAHCIDGANSSNCLNTAIDIAENRINQFKLEISSQGEIKSGVYEGLRLIENREYHWSHSVEETADSEVYLSKLEVKWREKGRLCKHVFTGLITKTSVITK